MLTENLARLEELDPATYRTYIDGAAIHGVLLAEKGGDPLQMAWLQWCIQEAIAAKGWHQSVSGIKCDGYNWQTYIHIEHCDPVRGKWSNNPATSLLAAYIAALEAQA